MKAGSHRNANTNAACENNAYVHVGKFVDSSAFAEAANRPYIKRIVREFPLMYRQSTDNIRLFTERSSHSRMLFALPQEYVRIIFACRIRVLM